MVPLSSRLLTYDEWLLSPPLEDNSDEIAKDIIQRLVVRLQQQTAPGVIAVLSSHVNLAVARDPLTCNTPDIVVYRCEKIVIRDGVYWSPPGLIIEVLSSSENRRRQEEKLSDYGAIGVPEVWLVSPEAETVEVLLLREGKLERIAILADGSLQPSQFTDVAISVPGVFS